MSKKKKSCVVNWLTMPLTKAIESGLEAGSEKDAIEIASDMARDDDVAVIVYKPFAIIHPKRDVEVEKLG